MLEVLLLDTIGSLSREECDFIDNSGLDYRVVTPMTRPGDTHDSGFCDFVTGERVDRGPKDRVMFHIRKPEDLTALKFRYNDRITEPVLSVVITDDV